MQASHPELYETWKATAPLSKHPEPAPAENQQFCSSSKRDTIKNQFLMAHSQAEKRKW
jgi:hypothetical protein